MLVDLRANQVFNANRKHKKAFKVIQQFKIGTLEGYVPKVAPVVVVSSSVCAIL